MFYVYGHYKYDTGEVFYIGKGVGKRAYVKERNNPFWKSVSKKHGYTVQILEEFEDELAAYAKEKELVLQIGRRDLGTGPLVNLTEGGLGVMSGKKHTPEAKKKISEAGRRVCSDLTKQKIGDGNRGKVRSQKLNDAQRSRLLGTKQSAELIEKRIAPLRGRKYEYRERTPMGEVTKKKIGDANRGRKRSVPVTDETRRKLSMRATEFWAKRKAGI